MNGSRDQCEIIIPKTRGAYRRTCRICTYIEREELHRSNLRTELSEHCCWHLGLLKVRSVNRILSPYLDAIKLDFLL